MPKLPRISNTLFLSIFALIAILGVVFFFILFPGNPFSDEPKVTVKKDDGKKNQSPVKASFSGNIVAINLVAKELRVQNSDDGKNYNVTLSSNALITANGGTSSISNLKVGDNVQIYSKTETNIDETKSFLSEWVDIQAPLDLSKVKTQ